MTNTLAVAATRGGDKTLTSTVVNKSVRTTLMVTMMTESMVIRTTVSRPMILSILIRLLKASVTVVIYQRL